MDNQMTDNVKLSDREKAAVVFSMVRAFEATAWPTHFTDRDKAIWRDHARIAKQILGNGAFNPLEHWSVMNTADSELMGEIFS